MNSFTLRPARLVAVLLALLLLTAVLAQPIVTARRAATAAPAVSCPASSSASGPADYHGKTLTMCNFAKRDLRGANFSGATLTAVVFIGANLTGADFSGAIFADSGNALYPNDFTLANLSNAKFATLTQNGYVFARFEGRTYFTYATLTCTDFSATDLRPASAAAIGNAIFGPSPLIYDRGASCRTTFHAAKMNCEFLDDWNSIDLAGADLSACGAQLRGRNFSGGLYAGAHFEGADLTGTKWTGVDLTKANFERAAFTGATGLNGTAGALSKLSGAKFNNADLQAVDLSYALLYSADFTNANLTGSSLQASVLVDQRDQTFQTAAKFTGAHLRDVNLSNAKLAGVTFSSASFYSSFGGAASSSLTCPTDAATCPADSRTGLTCSCSSVRGADLTQTDFSGAYLFGVDFGGQTTAISGTNFAGAILVGSNFEAASFGVDSSGKAPNFSNALLQGANLGSTVPGLANASLAGAYVDFGIATNPSNGNTVYLQLPAAFTRFRGWAAPGQLCVAASYGAFTTAPSGNPSLTCPDGNTYSGGCGAQRATNTHWKSGGSNGAPLSQASPPGWYGSDATYETANANGTCNSGNASLDW